MFKEKIESKEKEPINFKEIFEKRMEEIEPSENDELEFYDSEGKKIINQIIKKIPGVVFVKDGYYELWIEDVDKDLDSSLIHSEVRASLEKFIPNAENVSAYILESNDGKKFLTVSDGFFVKNYIYKDEERKQKFLDLIKKYNIVRIIGDFDCVDEGWCKKEQKDILINNDLVGKIREDSQLKDFAKKYSMTNSQLIRFRVRANSMFDAQKKKSETERQQTSGLEYNVVLDNLAREIIEEQD